MIFTNKKYTNLYLVGTSHNIINDKIISFLKKTKIKVIIPEDPLPLVYLSDRMNKIAEVYYLETIFNYSEPNNNTLKYHKEIASKIVDKHYDAPTDHKFNKYILRDIYEKLDSINKRSIVQILPADHDSDFSVKMEKNSKKYADLLLSEKLSIRFNELQNVSVEHYIQGKKMETFLSQLIYMKKNPFFKTTLDYVGSRNEHWVDNIVNNILPKYPGENIVLICGCAHLNIFLDDSVVSLFDKKYNIHFSCEGVSKQIPVNIVSTFIEHKNKANIFLANNNYKEAEKLYTEMLDIYQSDCLCDDEQFIKEYLNVLGNILTLYHKIKNKRMVEYYLAIAKKIMDYFKLNPKELPIGKKIIFLENKQY